VCVKRKASRKRKSVKRKASRKRKSVLDTYLDKWVVQAAGTPKRKASRKRKSAKKKASRKRKSSKRKASRKRKSSKRKVSRKHKFGMMWPFKKKFLPGTSAWRQRRAHAGFEKNLKAARKLKNRKFREDLLTVIERLHKGLPRRIYKEVAELFIEGAHGFTPAQRDTWLAKLKAGQKIPLSKDYAIRTYGSKFTKEQYQKANNRRIAAVWNYYFKMKHKQDKSGLSRDAFISGHKDELEGQRTKSKSTFKKWVGKGLGESARKANIEAFKKKQKWEKLKLSEKVAQCKKYVRNFSKQVEPGVFGPAARKHYKTHNCKGVMRDSKIIAKKNCQELKTQAGKLPKRDLRTPEQHIEVANLEAKYKQLNCAKYFPKKATTA